MVRSTSTRSSFFPVSLFPNDSNQGIAVCVLPLQRLIGSDRL